MSTMEIETTPKRWWQWWKTPQFAISFGFAVAFYFLIRLFEGVPYPQWPYRPMMGQTAFLLVCLCMMGAMWWWHGRKWAYYLLIHMFAFGFGAATLLVWQSTPAGPGGTTTDAWFNTAIVTRHRFGAWNADFAYKGLHSFYPSLYQLIVGKFAALTHTTAIKAMKYGFYWTAFLLPLGAYALWRKLLPALPAFLLVVVATAAARGNLAFKTYEVISLMVFIPWGLYYVAGLRRKETDDDYLPAWETRPLTRREWVQGGVIGGLSFMVFYYYYFLLILWVPLLCAIAFRQGGVKAVTAWLKPFVAMILVMMAVSAVYWVPLMGDILRWGMKSYQNRWFQPHMLGLPFDYMENWKGMVGIVLVVVLAARNVLARNMVYMMICLLAYVLLGHLGVYRDFPILHVRMVGMETYLFNLGLILGILMLLSRVREHLQNGWEKGAAIAFATVYAINITMLYNYEINSDVSNMGRDYQSPALNAFPEFTQKVNGKVLLTNRLEYGATRPIYLWICPNSHYSHPSSRYRDRVKFLALLQRSKNSDFIAWMLQHNHFDRVDWVMLDQNKLEIGDDDFPHLPNHNPINLQFDSTAFRGQYFEQDTMFREMVAAKEVPEDLWRTFDNGERRLAALFSDIEALDATVPEAEMQALKEEIRIHTRDYKTWLTAFGHRWLEE